MVMCFAGMDISRDTLDVHVIPDGLSFSVNRDGKGLGEVVAKLQAMAPQLVAMEATGGFETMVAAALSASGLPAMVVNPAQVCHFAQALGKRAKLSGKAAVAAGGGQLLARLTCEGKSSGDLEHLLDVGHGEWGLVFKRI